jgi:ABC-type lipoprotein export system ATPase subunit
MKRPRFNFHDLDKNDKFTKNNYYYEYLNKFNELSDKIIKSNQSYFITGLGGSGKTTLLKQIQSILTKQDKKHITLCPTNLAALLVGGITIHKFSTKLN